MAVGDFLIFGGTVFGGELGLLLEMESTVKLRSQVTASLKQQNSTTGC